MKSPAASRSATLLVLLTSSLSTACSSSPSPVEGCSSDASCGSGAYCETSSGTCLVDETAPAVAISSPTAGEAFAGATIAVSGTANDGSGGGVASVQVSLDGTTFVPAALAGGAFTATLAAPDVDLTNLVLTARAVDRAGNAGSATVTVAVDRRAPALAVTSPAEDGACSGAGCTGATVNAAAPATLLFSGTVSDAGGLAAAEGLVGRVLAGDLVVAGPAPAAVTGESWSFAWPVPAADGQAYRFELTAVDAAGHSTTRSRLVVVDRVAPAVSFTAPAAGQLLGAASVTVSGQASDASSLGVTSAELSTDGATFAPLALSAGQFSAPVAVPADADHASITATVRAEDALGNVGSASVQFFGDRVAPAVAVTSPAADAACSAHGACSGGLVSLASGATFTFQGTSTDPSGLAPSGGLTARVLDGATPVASQALPAGPSWSFGWSSLPADDGKEYVLEVTATDAAGNAATTSRRVWVDRVAPTATLLVDADRLVARTANLVTFSEEMNAPAVRAATSFSPSPPSTATYGTSDGRTFQFTDAANLAGYTRYTMTVGAGATDRAGNPTAQASQTFLTETVPFTTATVEPVSSSVLAASPRLVVDSDGRPHVVYQDQNATSGNAPRIASWNGKGTDAASFVKRTLTDAAWAGARPADLVTTGWTANDDDTTTPDLEVLMVSPTGTVSFAMSSSNVSTWSGLLGGGANALVTSGASDVPILAQTAGCRAALCTSASIERAPVARSSVGTVRSYDGGTSGWTTSLLATLGTSAVQSGAAVLDAGVLHFFDPDGTSSLTPHASTTAASGAAQAWRVVRVGLTVTAQRTGGGFLASGYRTTATPPFVGFRYVLSAACNANPLGGTWRQAEVTVSSGPSTIPVPTVTKVATAAGATTFAAAAQIGSGTIRVVKAPNGACDTAPALTVGTELYTGRDPALAIDGAGDVWLAYVSSATGTDGDLVVTKVAFPP